MKPTDLELLLFGLQDDVWRFCHDHGMFRRLTHPGQPDASNEATGGGTFASLGVDRLDQTSRKMRKALRDYNATVAALRRWKGALSQSQLSYTPDCDRSAYLSGLVLYELSFLRLSAPIDSILQVVHRHDQGRVDDATMQEVLEWTASEQAIESNPYFSSYVTSRQKFLDNLHCLRWSSLTPYPDLPILFNDHNASERPLCVTWLLHTYGPRQGSIRITEQLILNFLLRSKVRIRLDRVC